MEKLHWILRINNAIPRNKGAVTAAAAAALDCSVGAVHRYRALFRKRNWKGIADGRIARTSRGTHPLFRSFVAGLFDAHQRDNDDGAEVVRTLLDRWQLWQKTGDVKHAIPGYETCPPANPATGIPRGWSYDSILKMRPKAPERALAKHGAKAASKFLPPVLTTRYGSAILSRLLFDDQDLDNMLADGFLAINGITEASRPVSFNCLDFYTARHVDQHLRVMYKASDEKANKTLTGMEFAWFVVKQLQTNGWRTDELGTELIFEHGTANTWANLKLTSLGGHHSFEDAVEALTGGKCYVNRSGKFEGPVFAALCFRAQSTGNFRFKTWIESAFRLLRTYMQGFPGPIGSHARINGKDELYGIKLAENQLLQCINTCSDKALQEFLVENFRHELLDLRSFASLVHSVYEAVNLSTKHKLEGWDRCGFTVPLWRPNATSENWFAQHELLTLIPDPEERQMMLRRINASRDILTKTDYMSRQAAWDVCMARDRQILSKLPDAYVALMLPREWAKPVTVASNHCIELPNPLWTDTRDTYVCSWEHKGSQITLDAGKEMMVYHNPFFDGRAQCYSLDGSYITTLFPTVRAETWNAERKLEQLKMRSQVQSGHEAHIRARMADIGSQRQANSDHNQSLIALTREDRRRAATAAHASGSQAAGKRANTAAETADEALACIAAPNECMHSDDLDF